MERAVTTQREARIKGEVLTGMYANVLLEVVFELERLGARRALELAQVGRLVMADHVALQTVHVCERLLTHLAHLLWRHTSDVCISHSGSCNLWLRNVFFSQYLVYKCKLHFQEFE